MLPFFEKPQANTFSIRILDKSIFQKGHHKIFISLLVRINPIKCVILCETSQLCICDVKQENEIAHETRKNMKCLRPCLPQRSFQDEGLHLPNQVLNYLHEEA